MLKQNKLVTRVSERANTQKFELRNQFLQVDLQGLG